ncbi:MAG: hypothetical protein F6J98_01150 [Moorea sp. SIO4G2]|nr:hypothetical protein [Moorena sp. SIO4G2]
MSTYPLLITLLPCHRCDARLEPLNPIGRRPRYAMKQSFRACAIASILEKFSYSDLL